MCRLARHSLELLLGDVIEEFALDAERPPGERHLDLALRLDLIDLLLEQTDDMRWIVRRRDGHHRARFRNPVRGGQNGAAAQAVADQDGGCAICLAQVVGGGDQVVDVR